MKIGDLGASVVQINTVGKRYQCVFDSVQKITGALCVSDVINIPEPFVNYHAHETSPAKEAFSCIFYACKCRHEQNTKWISLARQKTCRTAAHASSKNNYVLFFDTYYGR